MVDLEYRVDLFRSGKLVRFVCELYGAGLWHAHVSG